LTLPAYFFLTFFLEAISFPLFILSWVLVF
jgi:hypothetical protein